MNELKKKIPTHVALIIDGNRRWAIQRNLSIEDAQRKTWQTLVSSFDWFFLRGIKVVSYDIFSPEHWQRDAGDIEHFFKMMLDSLRRGIDDFMKKDYKIVFSGRLSELSDELHNFCHDLEQQTRNNTSGLANICINYDGHCELMDAIKKIIRNNLDEEQIHEGIIKKYLYNQIPDPNVLVRLGGVRQHGSFLLWQSGQAETIFLKKMWPDFEEMDVMAIIDEYNR